MMLHMFLMFQEVLGTNWFRCNMDIYYFKCFTHKLGTGIT